MACNARVANKGAQLGLPELTLGAAARGLRAATPYTAFVHAARITSSAAHQASSPALEAPRACRA